MLEQYIYLICPFVSIVICQLIKFIVESIENRKLNFARLFNGCGGMPSSHTTFASSLTMLIGFKLGFDNVLFALGLVFTFIVSYDAMGVRLESEKQAEAINLIFDKFLKGKAKQGFTKLKEELGHKPLEVLVGLLLGTLMGFIFSLV